VLCIARDLVANAVPPKQDLPSRTDRDRAHLRNRAGVDHETVRIGPCAHWLPNELPGGAFGQWHHAKPDVGRAGFWRPVFASDSDLGPEQRFGPDGGFVGGFDSWDHSDSAVRSPVAMVESPVIVGRVIFSWGGGGLCRLGDEQKGSCVDFS